MALKLFSPAKINLFLRVLNRRLDGFHKIASLCQTISLGDYLIFSESNTDKLICNDSNIPLNNDNLIFRALDLFRTRTGVNTRFQIFLDKKIPIKAGLGGGSSNAATAFWAINQFNNNIVSLKTLMQWSEEIGSDVPFFLSHGSAYCTGRGEKALNVAINKKELWLITSKEGLSTPSVYDKIDLNELSRISPEEMLNSWKKGIPVVCNDLERAAFLIMPKLRNLKELLIDHGCDVAMSGSGSAMFCLGNPPQHLPGDFLVQKVCFVFRTEKQWYCDEKIL